LSIGNINPRWLWHAIDHHTAKVLAYVFGRRKDEVFLQLKALLEPFGLTRYYTDYWGAYIRHLDPDVHSPGKRHTQKIECKHLTLRTRIKRLVRKTSYFAKTTQMHDIVIGLFVNRYAFGRAVSRWPSPLLKHYPILQQSIQHKYVHNIESHMVHSFSDVPGRPGT
jgi:insertion element IS1 protein InsB